MEEVTLADRVRALREWLEPVLHQYAVYDRSYRLAELLAIATELERVADVVGEASEAISWRAAPGANVLSTDEAASIGLRLRQAEQRLRYPRKADALAGRGK